VERKQSLKVKFDSENVSRDRLKLNLIQRT